MPSREEIIAELQSRQSAPPREAILAELNKRGALEPQPQNLFQRIGMDFQRRQETVRQKRAEEAPFMTGSKAVGQAAGFLGSDIPSEILTSGFRALPDVIEQPLRRTGTKIVESPIGKFIGKGAEAGGGVYSSFKEAHPNIASVAEDVGNSGVFLAGVKPSIQAATTTAQIPGKIATKAIIPKIDDATREVGKLAQKYKIPVTLNELSGSRFSKTVQKVSQELPFSGEEGFRNKQLQAWNREVLKTTGEKGGVSQFTPKTMDRAFNRVGKQFDSFTHGKTFKIDDDFVRGIDEIRQEAKGLHTQDAVSNFTAKAEEVLKEFGETGEITGEKLSKVRANLNEAARKTTVPGTSELFHDLENKIIDLIADSSPEAASELSRAKYHYKNLLVVEPLAQKAVKGNISPQLLAQRAAKIYGRQYTRGNTGAIGDLARVGRELLPSAEGSDTAQKAALMMAVKKVGSIGTATGTATVAPLSTASVLGANRAYQSGINRNPFFVKRALK